MSVSAQNSVSVSEVYFTHSFVFFLSSSVSLDLFRGSIDLVEWDFFFERAYSVLRDWLSEELAGSGVCVCM